MTQIVSSISGIEIYAPSAGNAPTNSAEVSAIASGYQVVSSTATQLYAGTAFLTGVNDAPVSASRAGQAANASLANSAYYDGTGRLISALPDSAAVSSIASSYAEAAASSKLDTTAFNSGDFYSTSNPSGFITGVDLSEYATTGYVDSSVSGKADSSAMSAYALSADVSGCIDTVSGNSASWGGVDEATVSSIASSYAESAVSSKADSSALSSFALSADVSGCIDTVSSNSATWGGGGGGDPFPVIFNSGTCDAELNTGYYVSTSRPSLILSSTAAIYPRFIVTNGKGTGAKGSYYLSDAFEFTTGIAGGSGTKVLRVDPQQVSSKNFLLYGPSGSNTYGRLSLGGHDSSAFIQLGSGNVEHTNYIRPSAISSWWDVYEHVNSASATWGQGGVDSATVSSIASSYADNCWPLSSTTINSTARDINVRWGNDRILIGKESNIDVPHIEMGVGGHPDQSAGLESTRVFGGARGNATYRSWSLDVSGVRATGGVGDGQWQYGSAEYGHLTGVYDTVSSNSASWAVSGGDVYISSFGYNDSAISSITGSALYDKSAHTRITTVAGRVTNISAAVSSKMESSAVQSAYASASATDATAQDVLYILIPDGI